MNIGEVARESSLPPKTIRYYEEIGLISPARRANGYRDYSDNDAHTLRFIQRARRLGFSIGECRELVALYLDRSRASADVRRLAAEKVDEIDRRIGELTSLRDTLSDLIDRCAGNNRPDCPIIDMLADDRDPS